MTLRVARVVVGLLWLVVSVAAQISAAQTSVSSSVSAQVPPLIQFSNVATDEGGNSLSGMVSTTFSLYTGQRGGEALWAETQIVQLDSTGHYSVQLGVTKRNGVPPALFASGEARWLGVKIAEQAEQPRILLVSVPYALKAGDAATIGGLPPSAFVLASPAAAIPGEATTSSTDSTATSASPNAAVTGAGTANFIPLWDSASDIVSSVMTQTGSGTTARIGINTSTPSSTLDVKGTSMLRGSVVLPATGAATSAAGKTSQPFNLTASAFNSGTGAAVNQIFRLQSEPVGNNTSTTNGTLNLLYASGGNAATETGLKIASNGRITFAAGQTFPGVGTVSSVGLSAPGSDFTVSGSPVTATGTLGLTWKKAPTSSNTASTIVKRDGAGGFAAGAISASQLTTTTISTAQLTASGTMTAASLGLGTTTPTERLDLGNDGNVVIKTDPGNDTTPDLVGYNLIGRGTGGVPNKWSIYTAAVGGGFGVPANSFTVYQYPPNGIPSCCLERFAILPTSLIVPSPVVIDDAGSMSLGGASVGSFRLAVSGSVSIGSGDLWVEGCVMASGSLVGGACLSDARLKKDVHPFPSVLDKLVRLQPVSYNWRTEEFPQFHFGTSRTSGLIAQEVEKVFPEMVVVDKNGFKRVNYSALPYLMLQAIRELKAENDSLREQANDVAQLRKEVERLAGMVRTNEGTAIGASASAEHR